MEVDTINVVKLPDPVSQRRKSNPLPYALIEQDLRRALGQWKQLLHAVTDRKEMSSRSRTYDWSKVNVVDALPTDLLTYFVHQLEPDIAPEIGKLLMDGRVHLVLILSHREFPVKKDWCQNFKLPWSNKLVCNPKGIIIGEAEHGEPFAPLIQLHEMRAFTGKILGGLLEKIEDRKRKYDFDWN